LLSSLADRAESCGYTFPPVSAILCSYQYLSHCQRRALARHFAAPLLALYSATELGGSQIGVGCPEGNLHVRLDQVFVELLAGGKSVSGAELGSVSITWIFRRGSLTPRARRTWESYTGAAVGALLAAVVAALTASPPFTWAKAIILAVLVAASAATGDLAWAMVEDDLTQDERGTRRPPAVVLRRIDGALVSAPVFFYVFRVLAR